jgi:hypothetical protein
MGTSKSKTFLGENAIYSHSIQIKIVIYIIPLINGSIRLYMILFLTKKSH